MQSSEFPIFYAYYSLNPEFKKGIYIDERINGKK